MSKLTGWISDTESIDIKEIVDNYENELANKSNMKTNHVDNTTNIGDEVWSGSIEGSMFTTDASEIISEKASSNNNIEKKVDNNIEQCKNNDKNVNVEPKTQDSIVVETAKPVAKNEEKTIKETPPPLQAINPETIKSNENTSIDKSTQANNANIPPLNNNTQANSANTPPPLFSIVKEQKDPNTPPPPPPFDATLNEEKENPIFNDQIKFTTRFDDLVTKDDVLKSEEDDLKDSININAKNTKVYESSNSKRKTSSFKTIRFENITEEKKESLTSKIEQTNFEMKSEEPENLSFVKKEDFQKQLEESDVKTIKIQSTIPGLNGEGEFTANLFSPKMTQIYFKETIKAEDLDLTKEVNDADAITINASTEHKSKRKFGFFKKRKNS